MSEVILYRFGEALGAPDVSPFCVKMETYLRMAEIPFAKKLGSPNQAPKGKMPYIVHDGKKLGDSSHIIAYLKDAFQVDLDEGLSDLDRAHARAYQSMLEEHLYFVVVYFRWKVEAGWQVYRHAISKVMKDAGAPGFLIPMLIPLIRRGTLKSITAQGVGRHSEAEAEEMGRSILSSLSSFLGEKPYFLGETPTTLDATTYAMLSGLLAPIPGPLKPLLEADERLMAYCERMKARFFA